MKLAANRENVSKAIMCSVWPGFTQTATSKAGRYVRPAQTTWDAWLNSWNVIAGEQRGAAYMCLSVEAHMQEAACNIHMQAAGRKFDAVVSILQYVMADVVSPGIILR